MSADFEALWEAWCKNGPYVDDKAIAEGWLLSADARIERDDDNPRFADDDEAYRWVAERAAQGSAMHQAAINLHNAEDDE